MLRFIFLICGLYVFVFACVCVLCFELLLLGSACWVCCVGVERCVSGIVLWVFGFCVSGGLCVGLCFCLVCIVVLVLVVLLVFFSLYWCVCVFV